MAMKAKHTTELLSQVPMELRPLIPSFLQRRQQDLHVLRSYLEDGDYDSIRALGHRMKGSGGGYGLIKFTELGASLETAAIHRDYPEIALTIMELADHVSILTRQLGG
jgi:HPt (histidine-containing phosphotransfer) domain-containing protein